MSGVTTTDGLGLGSRESDVRRLHGANVTTETRPYEEEPAHTLTVRDPATHRGMAFLTDANGLIDTISVGGRSIGYMEGCL